MSSPIAKLEEPLFLAKEVEVYVLREDLNDDIGSGNKVWKLKYNLAQAKSEDKNTLLTFGGAYSNHLFAVAAAGKKHGFKTIAVIRGEETLPLNPTLTHCKQLGMSLHYVSRMDYRNKDTDAFIDGLQRQFGAFYLVPEGGTNALAIKGCAEMLEKSLYSQFGYICCAVGTGGTLAGLIAGSAGKSQILGIPVLKGEVYLTEAVSAWLSENQHNWSLDHNYHFGGYAKFKTELIDFIQSFYATHHIALDPIYTGKLFYGIWDRIAHDKFPRGSRILCIHTGGRQGIAGFNERFNLGLVE